MSDKHLHIISFDVPFPADYGGVIDVFYRLKTLHQLGVKITLHCFEYGRGKRGELEQFTEKVYYYPRKKSIIDSIHKKPFIVKSRDSEELIKNLMKDDYPVLFEGLHTTFFLGDSRLKNRTKLVRTHNIEHDYYNELANKSKGIKKQHYRSEAKKLKAYEAVLVHADVILAIKESEKKHFEQYCKQVVLVPAASNWSNDSAQRTTQPYFLFHGNLSVAENELGATWLIEHVFSPLNRCSELTIAGKNPSEKLIQLCNSKGINLVINPNDAAMQKLIHEARVHVFHTDQSTGVKLKLIHALSTSGHVIGNEKMVEGTGLENVCSIASTPSSFQELVLEKIDLELNQAEFDKRAAYLNTHFNTLSSTEKILALI